MTSDGPLQERTVISRQQHRALAREAVAAHRASRHRHTLHLYEDDAALVRTLSAFVAEGLDTGDSVVLVATAAHLRELERELLGRGLDLAAHRHVGRLVELDASEALAGSMVNGVPDAKLFRHVVEPRLEQARTASQTSCVRVHGEMGDLLWKQGNATATIRLESIWSQAVKEGRYSLLCTYLLDGFSSPEDALALRRICEHHGAIIPTDRYMSLSPEQRLRHVAELEQRARALEREIERRRRVEADRARLLEAESRARAEMTVLFRLTDTVNRAETLEQVYESALDGIGVALGANRASILLFDSDGVMRFKAWRGLSDEYRAAVEGHSPWGPGAKNPRPVLVADVRAEPAMARLLPALEREGVGSLGFFPLFTRGRLKGKFTVYYPGPHSFTDEEERVACAIADQIAFAISRSLATRERERLIGIVGHDLRNPLNAVVMSASALLRHELNDARSKLARRVLTSAKRMESLIGQLLDFAQARQGSEFPIHRKRSDAGEIARRVLDEIEAGHPKATLSLSVAGDCTGEWDADRIAQVLSNLVANAIHHGGGSAVHVRVEASADEAVAEVHNGGPPIAAAVLPNVFDPFRRGPPSAASAKGNGLGLGLFISREIVRAHGGSIRARSSAAEGTTFTVRLPRAPARKSSDRD